MLDNSLFRLDRLAHRRVRRLAAKAFSMSQTDKIMAGIVDIVSDTFDKVANEEVFDVSSTIAVEIPRRSIARLVGIPPENSEIFDKLGWAMVRYNGFTTSPEDRAELLKIALAGVAMLQDLIAERRACRHQG